MGIVKLMCVEEKCKRANVMFDVASGAIKGAGHRGRRRHDECGHRGWRTAGGCGEAAAERHPSHHNLRRVPASGH